MPVLWVFLLFTCRRQPFITSLPQVYVPSSSLTVLYYFFFFFPLQRIVLQFQSSNGTRYKLPGPCFPTNSMDIWHFLSKHSVVEQNCGGSEALHGVMIYYVVVDRFEMRGTHDPEPARMELRILCIQSVQHPAGNC